MTVVYVDGRDPSDVCVVYGRAIMRCLVKSFSVSATATPVETTSFRKPDGRKFVGGIKDASGELTLELVEQLTRLPRARALSNGDEVAVVHRDIARVSTGRVTKIAVERDRVDDCAAVFVGIEISMMRALEPGDELRFAVSNARRLQEEDRDGTGHEGDRAPQRRDGARRSQ